MSNTKHAEVCVIIILENHVINRRSEGKRNGRTDKRAYMFEQVIGTKRVQIKNVRTGKERREQKERQRRLEWREEKKHESKTREKREREKARQFDTFLLCNARVIITGARDARLIMTF